MVTKSILILVFTVLLGIIITRVSVNIPSVETEEGKVTGCKAGEEVFRGQTGKVVCLKKLPDAGKTCTASSQCLSGKCVVSKPQAEKGICYKYERHSECLDGFATIEKARNYPKGGQNSMQTFRCFI